MHDRKRAADREAEIVNTLADGDGLVEGLPGRLDDGLAADDAGNQEGNQQQVNDIHIDSPGIRSQFVAHEGQAEMFLFVKGHRHADEDGPAESDQGQFILPGNGIVEDKAHDDGIDDDQAEPCQDRRADHAGDLVQNLAQLVNKGFQDVCTPPLLIRSFYLII